MKALKQDNRGLSLVEMLVSFAILSFISVALVGLMTTGMRFFRVNTSYIGLQYEYQTAMTFVREYIVDCNGGMVVEGDTLYIVNRESIMYDHDSDPLTPDIHGVQFTTHAFRYNPANTTLYYIWAADIDNVPNIPAGFAGGAEVSTRMTDFSAVITKSDSTGRATVTTDMQFRTDTRQYGAAQDTASRNRVVIEVPEVNDTTATPPITIAEVPLFSMTYSDLQNYLEYLAS